MKSDWGLGSRRFAGVAVAVARMVRFLTHNSRINDLKYQLFALKRVDIWQAGPVERYFSQPTNTVSQTSPARQISLLKTVRAIDICGKNRLSISLPTTLNLFLLFYPFTRTLPTTNSPLPIRKIKLMPALSSTSGDITGSDRTVSLLVAGNRPRRFHHLDLAVDRR